MSIWEYAKVILDVGIVTFILYKVLMIVHNTKSMQILKGVIAVVALWVISGVVGLETLKFILTQVITYGIFGVFVIFQPELRSALEKMGRIKFFGMTFETATTSTNDKTINALVSASQYLADRHIGALINIARKDNLDEYIATGIPIDAKISKELLENIFTPNVPLHDGALILRDNRIVAGSCYLPLSDRMDISKELGTRHRAGIGLSEVTDAFTIVISEETGAISVTLNNKLYRGISLEVLRSMLEEHLCDDEKDKQQKKSFFRNFKSSKPNQSKPQETLVTDSSEEVKKDEEKSKVHN